MPASVRVAVTRCPSAAARSSPSASPLIDRPRTQGEDDAREREREDCGEVVVAASGERADVPEAEAVERRLVHDEDGRGQRGAERRDDGTGEGQADGRLAAAPDVPEQRDEDGRGGRTGEGEPHVAANLGDARPGSRARPRAAAPALTPRNPGSATGLCVTPCMTTPDKPSDMPTTMATSVRGSRISVTMSWALEPSGAAKARTTLATSSSAAPRPRLRIPSTTTPSAARPNPARRPGTPCSAVDRAAMRDAGNRVAGPIDDAQPGRTLGQAPLWHQCK